MRRVIQEIYHGGDRGDTRPLGRHALRRFYQGLSPNLVGATLSWGGYFWWFNGLKKYRYATDQVLTPTQQIAVSMEAGIYTACLTNPLWVVKTRMCLQPTMGGDAKYRSVPGALRTIWREEGVRGLYRGLVPALFGVGHGAIQFTCYEELKKRYRRQREGTIDAASFQHKIHPLHYLWMAATSKAVASLLTYPYQVIKSRLQASSNGYNGLTDVILKTFRYLMLFFFLQRSHVAQFYREKKRGRLWLLQGAGPQSDSGGARHVHHLPDLRVHCAFDSTPWTDRTHRLICLSYTAKKKEESIIMIRRSNVKQACTINKFLYIRKRKHPLQTI